MNETNNGSVGLFSMIPGLTQETDNPNLLSNLLANGERKEEFSSMQFNNAVIESFLKQHNLATSISSPPQTVADGIVPEINAGVNRTQQAYQAPPPPIPVVQIMDISNNNRKRKPDDPQLTQSPMEHATVPVSDAIPRELSADEKLLMKKQRRLVKNREAAQLFRQRQKEYINNLELKAAELTNANTEANARVELLASENKLMKEQLVYLRNFMKQAVAYSFPYPSMSVPQVSATPSSTTTSPQLSPTMTPPMGNAFMEMDGYPDLRALGAMSAGPAGARPTVITADGTPGLNMGVLGGAVGIPMSAVPVSSFPVSLMGMPVTAVPTMHSVITQQQIPQQQTIPQQTPSGVGLVPSRDEKDMLPD